MVRVLVDFAATNAALRKFRRSLPGDVQRGIDRHAAFAVRYIKKERFIPYPGPYEEDKDRDRLYRRLGKLQRSIRSDRLKGRESGVMISAGSGLPDARAVENEEGVVKVGQPFIEVPLPDNLTPRTGQKKIKTIEEALSKGGFLSKDKSVVLKRRGAKGRGKVEALFVKKRRVTIPPRFGFEESLRNDRVLVQNREKHTVNGVRRSIAKSFGRAGL